MNLSNLTCAVATSAAFLVFVSSPTFAQRLDREAAELYRRSNEAYQQGHFVESAELLEQAYERQPDPVLLFNIARARESAGDVVRAYQAYQRFLRDAAPDAPERPRAEGRVAVLRSQVEEPSPPSTEPAVEAATTTDPVEPVESVESVESTEPAEPTEAPEDAHAPATVRRKASAAPWVIAGTGVATLIAGVIVGVLAWDRAGAAENAVSHARAIELEEQSEDLALASNVLFVPGGVLALIGGIWGVIDVVGASESGARVSVGIGPARLELRGAF